MNFKMYANYEYMIITTKLTIDLGVIDGFRTSRYIIRLISVK